LTTRVAVSLAVLAATFVVAGPAHASPAPDTVEVSNVAHRGASAYAPENTLAAVREGIAMDGDLIEVDVQRTKDGQLVLMHDTNLARTTDVEQVFPDRTPWKVADFTYNEMMQLDAGSWKAAEFAGEKIPTLAETIELIRDSRVGLLLEVKAPGLYPGIEGDVARTMRAVPGYVESAVAADRLVVQSFDFGSMAIFKELELRGREVDDEAGEPRHSPAGAAKTSFRIPS
jgi:glycerophosphoryl diester phosphodiesterase